MSGLSARPARTCSVALVAALLVAPMLDSALGRSAGPSQPSRARALVEPVVRFTPPKVVAKKPAPVKPIVVPKDASAADRLDVFRGLGAWVDLYDMHLKPRATVARMRAAGVRTLYLQTGRTNTKHMVDPRVGDWLRESHRAGIKVVGWYLPYYRKLERDIARTVAIARFDSGGHRFDGLGIDIEFRSVKQSVADWNKAVSAHSIAVRKKVGPKYPIAAIPIPPLQMALRPNAWSAFPWRTIAKNSDVLMLMAYWSERTGCPEIAHHCAGRWTRENIQQARQLAGRDDVLIHIIGGIGNAISREELRAFILGAKVARADGASIYDVATTSAAMWRDLAALARLGR